MTPSEKISDYKPYGSPLNISGAIVITEPNYNVDY